jgi:SOS-response transcriptional repressor LexA
MIGLTERQSEALRFIAGFQREKGYSPSRREIGAALGLRSTSSSSRLIDGLIERRAIRTLPFRTRAIEILIPIPGADESQLSGFGLTERQQEALRFITGYIEANGIPPSVREIAVGIGASPEGTNYIQRILAALEANGAISRSAAAHRGITVLKPAAIPRAPDGAPLHFVRIAGQG